MKFSKMVSRTKIGAQKVEDEVTRMDAGSRSMSD